MIEITSVMTLFAPASDRRFPIIWNLIDRSQTASLLSLLRIVSFTLALFIECGEICFSWSFSFLIGGLESRGWSSPSFCRGIDRFPLSSPNSNRLLVAV